MSRGHGTIERQSQQQLSGLGVPGSHLIVTGGGEDALSVGTEFCRSYRAIVVQRPEDFLSRLRVPNESRFICGGGHDELSIRTEASLEDITGVPERCGDWESKIAVGQGGNQTARSDLIGRIPPQDFCQEIGKASCRGRL